MTRDGDALASAALMWTLSHYDSLFPDGGNWPDEQLDGVRELIELADSYALNEQTLVAGIRTQDPPAVRKFFTDQSDTGSVVLVKHSDVEPFRESLEVPRLYQQLKSDDAAHDKEYYSMADADVAADFHATYRRQRKPKFEELNTREALALLLYADSRAAAYIPERQFGFTAVARYADTVTTLPWATETFRRLVRQRLGDAGNLPIQHHIVPSFLFEALRNAETPEGIFASLRDLRASDAAVNYRRLVGRAMSPTTQTTERFEIMEDLRHMATREGLQPRIPRALKVTVALSSLALGVIFPITAPAAAAAPVLVETAEALDEWVRKRTNIFLRHTSGSYDDLYVELRRIFPKVRFTSHQLGTFLQRVSFDLSEK